MKKITEKQRIGGIIAIVIGIIILLIGSPMFCDNLYCFAMGMTTFLVIFLPIGSVIIIVGLVFFRRARKSIKNDS